MIMSISQIDLRIWGIFLLQPLISPTVCTKLCFSQLYNSVKLVLRCDCESTFIIYHWQLLIIQAKERIVLQESARLLKNTSLTSYLFSVDPKTLYML